MFDFDLGMPDMHLPIRDDDHLRAVLNRVMEDGWLTGHGEQRAAPQPVIVKAKRRNDVHSIFTPAPWIPRTAYGTAALSR
jgi:hypothetical protein